MTELKTLKDIKIFDEYQKERLREEAIKWIKSFRRETEADKICQPCDKPRYHREEIDWIKMFFNIGESDLE